MSDKTDLALPNLWASFLSDRSLKISLDNKAFSDFSFDINEITAIRGFLPRLRSYYYIKLTELDPLLIQYVSEEEKKTFRHQLSQTIYFFSMQLYLDRVENRSRAIKDSEDVIDHCKYLMHVIDLSYYGQFEVQLRSKTASSSKASVYIGFSVIEYLNLFIEFTEKVLRAIVDNDKTLWENIVAYAVIARRNFEVWLDETIDEMDSINERRLYWVWGGGMIQSLFDILPQNMTYMAQAQHALNVPAPYTGYISWVLYFVRLAFHLIILGMHTITGFWMSEEEKNKKDKSDEWEARKYKIRNDIIWGLINLACFFWLFGSGMLGYWGNVATTGLLVFDTVSSALHFYEDYKAHKAYCQEKELALETLYLQLNGNKPETDPKKRANYELQIENIHELIEWETFQWKYKKLESIHDLNYTITLLIGFALYACFLVPPVALPVSAVLTFGLVGGVVCHLLSLVLSSGISLLEIAKNNELAERMRDRLPQIEEAFDLADNDKDRVNYFYKKTVLEESIVYQEELAHYQKIQAFRVFVMDMLIPVVITAAFLFMPLGAGLGLLAAGFAVIIISKYLVNLKEPTPPEVENLISLPEKEKNRALMDRSNRLASEYGSFYKSRKPAADVVGINTSYVVENA